MIVVIENEPMVRMVVQETLLTYGYTVLPFANALDAFKVLQESPRDIQLLVIDLGLTGMTESRFIQAVLSIQPSLRALFISGYPESMTRRSRVTCPWVPYLPKPFSPRELIQAVRQVLSADPSEERCLPPIVDDVRPSTMSCWAMGSDPCHDRRERTDAWLQ